MRAKVLGASATAANGLLECVLPACSHKLSAMEATVASHTYICVHTSRITLEYKIKLLVLID